MWRKPCSCRYRASVATCSTVNVTRKMGLSREKPQYRQMLMHSLLTYNGAKNRITRPKCFRVRLCDCRANASRYDGSAAVGEISAAKFASESRFPLVLLRASAASTSAAVAFWENAESSASARLSNSEEKLMAH